MIDLQEFKTYVKNRKENFNNNVNTLSIKKDYISLAALYIDVLTSNHGEKWDNTQLYIELDDVLEILQKQKIKFQGKDISKRNTSLTDKNVINYKSTVKKTETRTNENGEQVKVQIGTVEVMKKKHVQQETIDIKLLPKTNAYGIPSLNLYGEYHKGFYDYAPANRPDIIKASQLPSIKVRAASRETLDRLKHIEFISDMILPEITERCQYGLAVLSELNINNQATFSTAGLIRLDFDIVDTTPVVDKITIWLNKTAFIQGYVSINNFIKNTVAFIREKLNDANISLSANCSSKVYVKGGYKNFEKQLIDVQEQQAILVEKRNNSKTFRQKALKDYEKLIAQQEQQEAKENELKKRQEKQHLKEEREQERMQKLTKKQNEHQEEVELMAKGLKQNILDTGGIPDKATYQLLLADVEKTLETDKSAEKQLILLKEALLKLIEQV